MKDVDNTAPVGQIQLANFADYLRHHGDGSELEWMISEGATKGVFTFYDVESLIAEFIPDDRDYDSQRFEIKDLADFLIYAGKVLDEVVEEAPELTGPLELVQAHANALTRFKRLKAEALQTIRDRLYEHPEKTEADDVLESA